MDTSQVLKSTQEQAVASWIDHLNQIRLNEFVAKLLDQDKNLEGALNEHLLSNRLEGEIREG